MRCSLTGKSSKGSTAQHGIRRTFLWYLGFAIFSISLLGGCETTETAGTVRHERVYPDGTKEVIEYRAPSNDAKGSGFSLGYSEGGLQPIINATFGASHQPPEPQGEGDKMGQWIFYGAGAICLILGLGLIGVGKHFKLGTLAFIGAGACVGIAVTISQFAWIWGYAVGAGLIAGLAFVGWNLWSDYKNRPPEIALTANP